MTGLAANRHRPLTSKAVVLAAAPVLAGLLAAWLALADSVGQSLATSLGELGSFAAFAVVGLTLAWHRPANPIGWLLAAAALCVGLTGTVTSYSVIDYRTHPGELPFGPVAVVLHIPWGTAAALMAVAVLLFPDGRLPSVRWRWGLLPCLAVGAVWVAGSVAIAASEVAAHHVRVDATGNLAVLDNPAVGAKWWALAQLFFFLLLAVLLLTWLAYQATRFRRSAGDRRQQLKWLMSGAAVFLISGVLNIVLPAGSSIWSAVASAAPLLQVALPVCLGVGVLRYRLYDIDRIISRTLAYAVVTVVLAGLYAGLVLLATQVLDLTSQIAVAAATLAAAALFNPLRRRVQHRVDRRFNRARYDADNTIDAFAARLQDATNPDAVRSDLLGTVRDALEPSHIALWLTGGPS